ncbi:MAG: type I 3-dehydroquinate dehydratase [Candidatus Helarchaeota archaeon]|nr:type I 3-dehydroquinate dehydratase [Candidatus Helarchaeota archaeon]
MICVAISATDANSAIEKSHKAIQKGADFIEVRIDHFNDPFTADFVKLVKEISSKLILTIRKPDEGGKFAFEEAQRIELIQKCINAQTFAVDLEFSIDADALTKLIQEAKKNQVKIILSFHDFQKTPDIPKMKEIILDAVKKDANYVKIIGTAASIEDNLKMLSLPQFAKENHIEIVAFAMGGKGTVSRILSPIFGAAFTFAALDKPTAPGQISIDDMKKNLQTFTSYSRK